MYVWVISNIYVNKYNNKILKIWKKEEKNDTEKIFIIYLSNAKLMVCLASCAWTESNKFHWWAGRHVIVSKWHSCKEHPHLGED